MIQKSTGLITVAAVLLGLLLGFAIWRTPAAGQGYLIGQSPFGLQAAGNLASAPLGRVITVSGSGEVRAKPDLAFVTVGVDTQAERAEQAQQENSARMAAVIEAIKKLRIPESDIQTSAFSLQPVYDSERRPNGTPNQVVGYRAINRATVRVADITKAGPVLDEAVKAGANSEGNIRFAISDDTALRKQALKKAVQDARVKADAMAGALGVTISGIHSAAEGAVSVPVMMEESFRGAPTAAAVPVETGEMTVTAQVQVVYSY